MTLELRRAEAGVVQVADGSLTALSGEGNVWKCHLKCLLFFLVCLHLAQIHGGNGSGFAPPRLALHFRNASLAHDLACQQAKAVKHEQDQTSSRNEQYGKTGLVTPRAGHLYPGKSTMKRLRIFERSSQI